MSKWYLNPGSNDDIVLSTRIRLARNLSSLPFQSRMTPEQKKELCQKVRAALQGVNLGENKLSFIEMNSLSDTQRLALVETHTISPEFMDSGKLGCDECYRTFYRELAPSIEKIHGKAAHSGKVPRSAGAVLQNRRKAEQLKAELAQAIREENFEKAAGLRDQIKALESEGPHHE